MTNAEFAKRLRKLAKVYATNPALKQFYGLTPEIGEYVFCSTPESLEVAKVAFGVAGEVTKSDTQHFEYRPALFPEILVHAFVSDWVKG